MEELILENPQLFQNLIELQIRDNYIDLHNNYDCCLIAHSIIDQTLKFVFNRTVTSASFNKVVLLFNHVEIMKINFPLDNSFQMNLTLDTLYRGRFESKDSLKEYNDNNQAYYYIDFYEKDHSMEIFANGLKILF